MWSYRPDSDITTPNVITDITGGLIPTTRGGYRAPYAYGELWYEAATSQSGYAGAALCINNAGAGRLFVCSNQKIWECTSTGTRTDRSKGGGSYTSGSFFTFCQMGDTTIAANKSDALQSSTTGAFADTAGSPPKAKICLADANQVILLNYNDGTDTPDGWWNSDTGTTATWTPATSNEAKNGRLRDSGGAITAGCNAPYGGVIAFKKNAMYVGTYVGQPLVRQWRKISDRVGCGWIEACVNTGKQVFFADFNDVWEFDGSQVRSITDGIRKTIRETVLSNMSRVALQWDATNSLLYLWYGTTAVNESGTGGLLNGCYVYDAINGVWGQCSGYMLFGATLNSATDTTSNPVGFISATTEEVKTVFGAVTSITGSAQQASQWVFYSNNNAAIKIVSFGNFSVEDTPPAGATPLNVTWTCSWVGDYQKASTVQRVVPNITTTDNGSVTYAKYSMAVTSKSYTPYGTQSGTATSTMANDYRFNILSQGHWHKAVYTVDMSAAHGNTFEWFGHTPEYVPSGRA